MAKLRESIIKAVFKVRLLNDVYNLRDEYVQCR